MTVGADVIYGKKQKRATKNRSLFCFKKVFLIYLQ